MSRISFTWGFAIVFQSLVHLLVVSLAVFLAHGDGTKLMYIYGFLSIVFCNPIKVMPLWSFPMLAVFVFFGGGVVLMLTTGSLFSFFITNVAYVLVGYNLFAMKGCRFQRAITPLVRE